MSTKNMDKKIGTSLGNAAFNYVHVIDVKCI